MLKPDLPSPKRERTARAGHSAFYPYYAGFSTAFAKEMLMKMHQDPEELVLDPWNGAGTTTAACAELGLNAIGCDLNPAMVVIAKGRLLAGRTLPSIEPLAQRLVMMALDGEDDLAEDDALRDWFTLGTARFIRRLERATFRALVNANAHKETNLLRLVQSSDLAAFFYIGLFRTVRELLMPLRSSNPTWMRRPRAEEEKVRASQLKVHEAFSGSMKFLSKALGDSAAKPRDAGLTVEIQLGASQGLVQKDGAIKTVLTSPPYCTRIDYAVATAGELAVMGIGDRAGFGDLRSSLMGAAKVSTDSDPSLLWGDTCVEFLDRVYNHHSKASKAYYFQSHCNYFDSLYRSIREISRVLQKDGYCALVVQNSHYKDVLNDLPQICIEMSEAHSLTLESTIAYSIHQSFSRINKKSKPYRTNLHKESEEVLLLRKVA